MSYWYDWEKQLRKENKIWNRGFKWGVAAGFGFSVLSVLAINWWVP